MSYFGNTVILIMSATLKEMFKLDYAFYFQTYPILATLCPYRANTRGVW